MTDANLTRSVRHPVLNAIRFAFMTSRPLRPLYGLSTQLVYSLK